MKYCDLVMKGGITSGLVYPNAVLALSKGYRFKNIGGTSAGAIAAALSAAAAYGDRTYQAVPAASRPKTAGFQGLGEIAGLLATEGFIFGLFQPADGGRNAFRLLVALAGRRHGLLKSLAALIAVPSIAPIETIAILVLLLVIGYWLGGGWAGVLACVLPATLCALAAGGAAAFLRVARVARRNLLGLCSGMPRRTRSANSQPALTEWLHETVQQLSGKPLDEPLTFADLWTAERYEDEPRSERAITLQMITTDVSHREPRSVPFEKAGFWFRCDEFERLFPASVVTWMVDRAGSPIVANGEDYFRLPNGGDLPVLVGMRMSLSFPLLISAVPLHEPVRGERARDNEPETTADSVLSSAEQLTTGGNEGGGDIKGFRTCWFSDGGISSNFPIHLFDAALPRWPTFAVNLRDAAADDAIAGRGVFLPTENNQGWQQNYHQVGAASAEKELANFLFGIIATMQNWRDLLQSRAPGHRDRIVHVALSKQEGGLNLNMPQPVLDTISGKGAVAGEKFAEFSFDNHYWVRWRNLASALQRYTIQVAENAKSEIPDYAQAYDMARGLADPPSYKFQSQERRAQAEALLSDLEEKGGEWGDLGPDLTTGAPRPLPQLRITPTY